MACRRTKINKLQKNKEFLTKLHILRNLVNSNSDKTSSIVMDTLLCISALTLKLKELRRESMDQHVKHNVDNQLPLLEVNVEKQGANIFRLDVKSEKGKDNLVQILETFEEMEINVMNARVSCTTHFAMEATIEISQEIDPNVLSETILKAIERSTFY